MDEETTNSQQTADTTADELAALRAELETARTDLAAARGAQATSIAAFRDFARSTRPDLPPDAIDGGSPEEISAAIAKADAFKAHVLEQAKAAEGNGHAPHVPAGGARPVTVDVSKMSPMEKIRYGLSQQRAG